MANAILDPSKKNSWKMFNRIASTYDNVNRLLSFGLDIGWRKKVNSLLPLKNELKLLDLATGTADQIILLCSINDKITSAIGMDLSEGMLEKGKEKVQKENLSSRISLQLGDAVNIPSENNIYDAVTISFGIRNVPDVLESMKEMNRVLQSGGKALILEFSLPKNIFVRWGHLFYLRYVLPLVGGILSGDYKAYRYLNTTIEDFPYGEQFGSILQKAGFSTVHIHPVSFGIATIYEAIKE
jgi:demethylmenaquinone methyltransferase / 2-methoxy-6-polyprenyl-1,4-benzoquinol methylase